MQWGYCFLFAAGRPGPAMLGEVGWSPCLLVALQLLRAGPSSPSPLARMPAHHPICHGLRLRVLERWGRGALFSNFPQCSVV